MALARTNSRKPRLNSGDATRSAVLARFSSCSATVGVPRDGARGIGKKGRPMQRVILNERWKNIFSGRVSKDAVAEAVLGDGVVKFENVEMSAV